MQHPCFNKLLSCWMLLQLVACTTIVDSNATQCLTDYDCQVFAGSVCNVGKQVCVPATKVALPIDVGPINPGPINPGPIDTGPIDAGPIDAGPIDAGPIDAGPIDPDLPDAGMDTLVTNLDGTLTCKGSNGCYACTPSTYEEFLSACTEATCIPFDNHTRLTNLAIDGSLKPLP